MCSTRWNVSRVVESCSCILCPNSFSCVLVFVRGGGCVSSGRGGSLLPQSYKIVLIISTIIVLLPLRCHFSTLASSGLMKVVFILGKCSIQSHFPIINSIRMMLFDVSQAARRENIYFYPRCRSLWKKKHFIRVVKIKIKCYLKLKKIFRVKNNRDGYWTTVLYQNKVLKINISVFLAPYIFRGTETGSI